jgi:sugar/nucleoside kinase (ribokinase family)
MHVSVDPASTGPCSPCTGRPLARGHGGATLLLPNAAEARLLTGCGDAEGAARALATRYPVVAVKLGPDGALWATTDAMVHRPAHRTTVVDTTGAGDAFAAGLLAARLGTPGIDPAAALDAGLALAAAVVRQPGAR